VCSCLAQLLLSTLRSKINVTAPSLGSPLRSAPLMLAQVCLSAPYTTCTHWCRTCVYKEISGTLIARCGTERGAGGLVAWCKRCEQLVRPSSAKQRYVWPLRMQQKEVLEARLMSSWYDLVVSNKCKVTFVACLFDESSTQKEQL
jgi:hypothetical protein